MIIFIFFVYLLIRRLQMATFNNNAATTACRQNTNLSFIFPDRRSILLSNVHEMMLQSIF